jgi:hypothetical protein
MPSTQQIERFTLAFHKLALQRLRDDPGLVRQAVAVLDRWESNGVSAAGQRYRDTWRKLLAGDMDHLEHFVCSSTDEAATLRGASPLGFLLGAPERMRIRQEAMAE